MIYVFISQAKTWTEDTLLQGARESISAEPRSISSLPYGSPQKLRLYKYVENPVVQPGKIANQALLP
jgi:hypothetical protein